MRDGYCRAHKRAMNAAYRATHAERERDRVAAWKAVHRPARPRRTALDSNERQRAYRARKAATDPAYWRNRYLAGKMARWRRAQGRW